MSAPIIDTQTHYLGDEAAGIVERYRTRQPVAGIGSAVGPDTEMRRLDARLQAMDEAGVLVSVMSAPPIGTIADPAVRRDLARACNDGLAEACARHPDRFVMAAMLPLPDCEAAARELERLAGLPALRAIMMVAQTTGYRPDEIGLEAVLASEAAAGLPLIIHPAAGVADLSPAFDLFGLSSGLHAPVSTSLVAARIMASGMLDRLPDLELILTHLGGTLPFLIDRLDSRANGPAARKPSEYLRERIWVDNCGYPVGSAMRCALEVLGADRMIVGSDWPSRPIREALDSVRALGLTAAEESAILGQTAARWFLP